MDGAVVDHEPVAGEEFVHAGERGVGCGHEAEGEVGLDRVVVELDRDEPAGEQALQLGGEQHEVIDLRPVERLDPEPVACEHGASGACIPNREPEHSPEPLDEAIVLGFVEVREDLGVATASEPVAVAFQPGA